MRKMWGIAAVVLMACGGTVAPGTLTKTIRDSESQRVYEACMAQPVRNKADLRRNCKKVYILVWANWAWEDCINEGILDCGSRPTYADIY